MVIEKFELTLNQTDLNGDIPMRQPRQNYALRTSACVNLTPPVTIKIFIFILKKADIKSLYPKSCVPKNNGKSQQKSTSRILF